MGKEYTVVIERDKEGYYIGSVPELRGCHTQARSLDELVVITAYKTSKIERYWEER